MPKEINMYDRIRTTLGSKLKKSNAPNIWRPEANDKRAIGAKTLSKDLRYVVLIKPPR
jgi:hypothetical protein